MEAREEQLWKLLLPSEVTPSPSVTERSAVQLKNAEWATVPTEPGTLASSSEAQL